MEQKPIQTYNKKKVRPSSLIGWLKDYEREGSWRTGSNEFGVKISEMARALDLAYHDAHKVCEEAESLEVIELNNDRSDRVRLVRSEVGW